MGIIERIRGQQVHDNLNVKSLHHPQPAISVANNGTTDLMDVTFQADSAFQTDSAGNRISASYPFYLTTDTAGLVPVSGTLITGSSQGDTSIGGAVVNERSTETGFVAGRVTTNTTGAVVLTLTNTGTDTAYAVFVIPNGRLAVSPAIVWT